MATMEGMVKERILYEEWYFVDVERSTTFIDIFYGDAPDY